MPKNKKLRCKICPLFKRKAQRWDFPHFPLESFRRGAQLRCIPCSIVQQVIFSLFPRPPASLEVGHTMWAPDYPIRSRVYWKDYDEIVAGEAELYGNVGMYILLEPR